MKKARLEGLVTDEDFLVLHIQKSQTAILRLRDCLVRIGFSLFESNRILSPLGTPDDNYSNSAFEYKTFVDKFVHILENRKRAIVFYGANTIALVAMGKNVGKLITECAADLFDFNV